MIHVPQEHIDESFPLLDPEDATRRFQVRLNKSTGVAGVWDNTEQKFLDIQDLAWWRNYGQMLDGVVMVTAGDDDDTAQQAARDMQRRAAAVAEVAAEKVDGKERRTVRKVARDIRALQIGAGKGAE